MRNRVWAGLAFVLTTSMNLWAAGDDLANRTQLGADQKTEVLLGVFPSSRSQADLSMVDPAQFQFKGNLIGIDPAMTSWDYQDQASFYSKLDLYLATAKAKGYLVPGETV